jgi:hypothetical protein
MLTFCYAQANAQQTQAQFWNSLQQLCGKTFQGTVLTAPANDTVFAGKRLLMHVRSCEEGRIRIPFLVGEDRSRTWVLTKQANRLQLKHDHRHADGAPDRVTQYGGSTTNPGTAEMQVFPADEATVQLLPAAGSNVWWIEIISGKSFTYNVRRIGTDRLYSIRFDLTTEVETAAAPWGWKDE